LISRVDLQAPRFSCEPAKMELEKTNTNIATDVASDVETQGFDPQATKKLLRKLDWHLIPFMSLIYLCAPQP
jgi:hypothetical protein